MNCPRAFSLCERTQMTKLMVFLSVLAVSRTAKTGSQLHFWDEDGWSCEECQHLRALRGALVGEDTDASLWYFSAPHAFVQRLRCADAFSFRISHPEFDSKGGDMIEGFDLVVVSPNGNIALRKVFEAWAAHTEACVVVPEDVPVKADAAERCRERLQGKETASFLVQDGWLNVQTGEMVSSDDARRIFRTARDVRIRGGFYLGREITFLDRLWIYGDHLCESAAWREQAAISLDDDPNIKVQQNRIKESKAPVSIEAAQEEADTSSHDAKAGQENSLVMENTYDSAEELSAAIPTPTVREENVALDPESVDEPPEQCEAKDKPKGRGPGLQEQSKEEEMGAATDRRSDHEKEVSSQADEEEPQSENRHSLRTDDAPHLKAGQGETRETAENSPPSPARRSALDECEAMRETWAVQPCVSWGRANAEWQVQERWAELDCDSQLGVKCVFSEDRAAAASDDLREGAQQYAQGRACLERYRGWGKTTTAAGEQDNGSDQGGSGSGVPAWVQSRDDLVTCAVSQLEAAAAVGHAGAMRSLGEMREYGEDKGTITTAAGGGKNGEAAYEGLLRRAAGLGDGDAEWALSVLSMERAMYVEEGGEDRDRWELEALERRYRAATLGSEEAMLGMGSRAYEACGAGVMAERGRERADQAEREAKCEEAFQWYRAVADRSSRAIQESGGSDAETEQVRLSELEFDESKDERESEHALSWMQDMAARGGGDEAVEAQVQVAVRKFHGVKGAERDVAEGAEYLEMAAEAGDGTALANYGYMLANGWGVEQDVGRAVDKFERAIELGGAGGHVGMGYLYAHGLGHVEQDWGRAFEHYAKAAEMGDVQAIFNVGEMFRVGQGVGQDHARSFELFRTAALHGHFKGMLMLGLSYWYGWGVERNCGDAVYLLKLVAERGPAGRTLRDAYSAFKARDFSKAFRLYLRAADAGYEVGQCNLATMMRKRQGVADGRSADELTRWEMAWWSRANKQGSGEAAVALGHAAAERGMYDEAKGLWERALVQGDKFGGKAALALGNLYENGQGVEVDREKARALYQMAGRAGGEDEVASTVAQTVLEAKTMWEGLVQGVRGLFGW